VAMEKVGMIVIRNQTLFALMGIILLRNPQE
jgi:hypothetical protein